MALLEYDLEPQQLAMDVASGAVDLSLEAELLREPDRRYVAEAEASRLAAAALERIDAQRTVRSETLGVVGDASQPWLGTTLTEREVGLALDEASELINAGLDLLRVEVPIGRELADLLIDFGRAVPEWRPRDGVAARDRAAERERAEFAPTGSHRALTMLRAAVDEAAVERRAYVRLATVVPALGAPEGAVVAAFERLDLIASDAMAEIVADAVEPDRALADHAFTHRLARRAGTSVLVSSGPLVVAPDMTSGVPSDPATRAGRALALQLLGVTMAVGDGLPRDQIVLGVLPPWLTEEPAPAARAIAEVAVRRALFPGHPFGFMEPAGGPDHSVVWPHLQAATAAYAGETALVLRTPGRRLQDTVRAAASTRAAASVAADVARSTTPGVLTGPALDHARGMIEAAVTTLDRLGDGGWRTVAGDPPGGGRGRSRSGESVAERTDPFDPFEWDLEGRR